MDSIEEELRKLGVPMNEEEELNKVDDLNSDELQKELDNLLRRGEDEINEEDEENIEELELSDSNEVEELNKMLSQVSIGQARVVPELIKPAKTPEATDKVDYEKLTREQIQKCQQAFEFYKSMANKEKAILFGRRQKALEADLENIKELKSYTKCQVQYDVAVPVNGSIKDDELEVSCEGLNPGQRLGVVLEFYSDVQAKQITNSKKCELSIKRADLRTSKFFEHRRIRVHLMEESSYLFFFTALKTVEKQSIKLDALLSNNEFTQLISFKEGTQKIKITLRLRRPISSTKNGIKVREVWQVASRGSSAGLYPELPVEELFMLPVEDVKSYNGLEYEISVMQKLRDTPQYDGDRLLLLETQRDMMSLQVQLGRITPEQYRGQLEKEREVLKHKAVSEKRKPVARMYLKHMKLVEEELKEMEEE